MLEQITTAFPGSRLRLENHSITGPLQLDGQFHSLRLRLDPIVEIFVDVPSLDGFELSIQWGDRTFGDTDIGDPAVDDAYFIKTNDPLVARMWLDERGRRSLAEQRARIEADTRRELERIHALRERDPFDQSQPNVKRSWPIEVGDGRVVSTRGVGPARCTAGEVVEILQIICAIAGGTGRWSERCSAMARLTGSRVKTVADRIALGGPALVLEHQRVDVDVRFLRRETDGDDRLSTRVRANRATVSPATWSAIDDEVRGPLPAIPSGKKVRPPAPLRHLEIRSRDPSPPPFALLEPLFVRPGTKADKARAVIAGETDVTVWFDGAVLDAEVIALATRFVAQLATDTGISEGPYR
ncbi:MAG: hypothetical protein JWP01_466 [Myxococcales bacterium]|nr:hypothetical protein [Myxococcales bacterium]